MTDKAEDTTKKRWERPVTLLQWARSMDTHIGATEGRAIRMIHAGRVTDAQKALAHVELMEQYGDTVFGPAWRQYLAENPEPKTPSGPRA